MIFTQERAPRETFTYSKSIIETLKKSEICLRLTMTPERLFVLFIVKFGHISLLFLVFCC